MKPTWEKLLEDRGYVLRQTLGEGAYSKVKLAYSFDLKREVAIKCITFEGSPKEFISNFLPRELKILPKLRHKNIVKVYEIYQSYNEESPSKSYVCIVMEYARHGDLLKYIQKKGALSSSETRRYFWQICQAVKYCHSKNLCHRDLKCENLLLGKNRTLLLTDFGFCKPVTVDAEGNVELSSTFCGSAAYAAPETLQGEPYNPFMHDMWGLGVIMYIMACGEMPFDDSNLAKMIKVQLRNRIRFPSRMRYSLSSTLKNLIRLLLEVNVSRRGTIDDVLSHPFFHASPDRPLLEDSSGPNNQLEKISSPPSINQQARESARSQNYSKEHEREEKLYVLGDAHFGGDYVINSKGVGENPKKFKLLCSHCGHTTYASPKSVHDEN